MQKRLLVIVAVCALLLTPVLAAADDLFPPDWRGGDRTIYALWDAFNDKSPDLFYPDVLQTNPTGLDPQIAIDITNANYELADEQTSGKLVFATTGIEFPVLTIKSLNFDQDNPFKRIRLQLTYAYNRSLTGVEVSGLKQGDLPIDAYTVNFIEQNKALDEFTYYSAMDILIYPNPKFEKIDLTFGGDCLLVLEQVVFDSQCVVPIPGALLLLGTGMVRLAAAYRRKAA